MACSATDASRFTHRTDAQAIVTTTVTIVTHHLQPLQERHHVRRRHIVRRPRIHQRLLQGTARMVTPWYCVQHQHHMPPPVPAAGRRPRDAAPPPRCRRASPPPPSRREPCGSPPREIHRPEGYHRGAGVTPPWDRYDDDGAVSTGTSVWRLGAHIKGRAQRLGTTRHARAPLRRRRRAP